MKARPNLADYLKSVARMRRPVAPCLDEQEVVAFYSGTLGQMEAEGVRNHLADCPKCLDLAAEVRQFVEAMSGTVAAPLTPSAAELSRESVRTQTSARQSLWQTLRAYLRVNPVFAFSVVAAIALVAGSALLIAEVFGLQNQVRNMQSAQAEKDRRLQELEQELALERTRVEQLTAELQGRTGVSPPSDREPDRANDQRPHDQPGREPRRDAAVVASLVLTSSLVRDPTQRKPLELSAATSHLELRVRLGTDEYRSYRAVLKTADGEQKFIKSGIKAQAVASGKEVIITIPSSILDKRDYVLKLIGVTPKGGQEVQDEYPFSIVRK